MSLRCRGLLVLAAVLAVAQTVFYAGNELGSVIVMNAAFESAFAVMGVLIITRVPGHILGPIFVLEGLSSLLTEVTESWSRHAAAGWPGADIVGWIAAWSWLPSAFAYICIFLLFPSGRLPSRRWRTVLWLGLGGSGVAALGFAVSRHNDVFVGHVNPLGDTGLPGALLVAVGMAGVAGALVAAIVSLFVRFRASSGVERQQLKWLTFTGSIAAVVLCIDAVTGYHSGLLLVLTDFVFLLIAISAGIAILRYRLYDIDVVIKRTLVYLALTVTLAGAYLGAVLLLQFVLRPLTSTSDLAIAGSTLAVAALSRPARIRIQGAVDQRFFRRQFDASQTLEAFGARVRDEVDLTALTAELQEVVVVTMQPAHVSLWLRA